MIMSDCRNAYNCLESEGFKHLAANHSYDFVNPETGAHMYKILSEHWEIPNHEDFEMISKVSYDTASSEDQSRDQWKVPVLQRTIKTITNAKCTIL